MCVKMRCIFADFIIYTNMKGCQYFQYMIKKKCHNCVFTYMHFVAVREKVFDYRNGTRI